MAVELLASANELDALLADSRAPVDQDRSFFVCNSDTYADHAELRQLLDPVTGLPYPISPPEKPLPLHNEMVGNWHHGIHPRTHWVLQTVGGRAMRSAQIQLVYARQHNQGKEAFHNYQVGPWVHREAGHQLGMCTMAAAGVTPVLALHTRSDGLWLEPLTLKQQKQWTARAQPKQFEPWQAAVYGKFYGIKGSPEEAETRLAERNRQRAEMRYRNVHYGYPAMQEFFTDLMFEQDLSNASRQVREFMSTGNNTKGLQLMDTAIAELVRSSVTYNGQTLKSLYATLHQAGRLNPAMPPDVEEIVRYKIGDTTTRRSLVPEFYRCIRMRQESAVA